MIFLLLTHGRIYIDQVPVLRIPMLKIPALMHLPSVYGFNSLAKTTPPSHER